MAVANILPNELSLLDNVTYNVKLLMMHPGFPGSGLNFTTKNLYLHSHYVIAETGKTTGFIIKDIGFYHIVQAIRGNKPVGISGQLNIIEPYGMSLYERIVLGADSLGIENHTLAKYIIHITFKGYKPDGAQTVVDYDWIMPTFLERVSSTVTEQGSDYTIKFLGMDYISNMSSAKSSNETITIVASKFGEFLDKLKADLNKIQEELVEEESQMQADTYDFLINPKWIEKQDVVAGKTMTTGTSIDIADFDLGALHIENQEASRQIEAVADEMLPPSVLHAQPMKIKITMSLGTHFNDHVLAVFMNTIQMQKLIRRSNWENPYNKWMMEFENDWEDKKFDPIRNQYAKHYKTTLHQHFVVGEIKDGIEYNNARTNKHRTQQKIDVLTTHGLLRKAYYYIYTGLNTEVLNFNFGFDNLYFVATEVYSNITLGEQQVGAGDGTMYVEPLQTIDGGSASPASSDWDFEDAKVDRTWPDFAEANVIGGSNFKDGLYLEDIPLARGMDGPFGNPKFIPEVIASDLVKSGGSTPYQKAIRRMVANHISGDNFELSMTIKGDPFWLGEVTGANQGSQDFAKYKKGGNYLYIEFRVPDRIGQDSGQMELSTASTISGLYRVTRVDSNFSDGQFVQTLTGYLDISFALSQVRNNIPDPGGAMR